MQRACHSLEWQTRRGSPLQLLQPLRLVGLVGVLEHYRLLVVVVVEAPHQLLSQCNTQAELLEGPLQQRQPVERVAVLESE